MRCLHLEGEFFVESKYDLDISLNAQDGVHMHRVINNTFDQSGIKAYNTAEIRPMCGVCFSQALSSFEKRNKVHN